MTRERNSSATENNIPKGIVIPSYKLPSLVELMFASKHSDGCYYPERILKSGNATIVFWGDGTKTVVKLPEGNTPDDYAAFTAALAKKVFGTNTQVKKIIREKTEVQKPKEMKGDTNAAIPAPAESVE